MRQQDSTSDGRIRFGPEGRFELVAPLGTSPTGGVFLAIDREDGAQRALKLLDNAAVEKEAVDRFLAEARVLEGLRHPHVVHAWDHGCEQGFCWYAMDFMPGGNLEDQLRAKARAPAEHALTLTFQVLLGLHAVHRAGLIHRDVKLTNVMIDRDGRARVTDFGVAHHPKGTVGFETVPGQTLGTPGYGAPEQWSNAGTVGAAADLFATGVLLYRLLTRKRPDHLHLGHFRPALLSDLPEPIVSVLLRSTRPDPDERYADAVEMARATVRARDQVLGRSDEADWMARFDDEREVDWASLEVWLRSS